MTDFQKNPVISIIVPVYNVQDYLPRCLNSIRNSTFKNFEVICVDDGSTDDSGKILDQFQADDERFTVIHTVNRGLSAARNEGMSKIHGRYCTFIDSDDWIHEDFFALMFELIERYSSDLAICGFVATKDPAALNQTISKHKEKSLRVEALYANRRLKSYVWRKLYRTETISNLRFKNHKIEDAVFNIDYMIANPNATVIQTDAILYAYYQRPDSLVRRLNYLDSYDLSEYYHLQLTGVSDKLVRKTIAVELIKRLLSVRFAFIAIEDSTKTQICNLWMEDALNNVPLMEIVLRILARFPQLYRLGSFANDKTMKDYEKSLKNKRLADINKN